MPATPPAAPSARARSRAPSGLASPSPGSGGSGPLSAPGTPGGGARPSAFGGVAARRPPAGGADVEPVTVVVRVRPLAAREAGDGPVALTVGGGEPGAAPSSPPRTIVVRGWAWQRAGASVAPAAAPPSSLS